LLGFTDGAFLILGAALIELCELAFALRLRFESGNGTTPGDAPDAAAQQPRKVIG